MSSLKDVKVGVRALIEDPEGRISPDVALIPMINIVYKRAINQLAAYSSPFIEQIQYLLNVPAGTTNLTTYQVVQPAAQRAGQPNAPLANLLNPLLIEYKQAGQPENCYCEVIYRDDLPNITPQNYIPGGRCYYTWRSWQIYLTPLGFPADFSVKGEFKPAALLKDEDQIAIHPAMSDYLTFATAAMIGASRVNASYIQTWGEAATEAMDDVIGWLVRKDQGSPVRVGRMTGRRRRGWY